MTTHYSKNREPASLSGHEEIPHAEINDLNNQLLEAWKQHSLRVEDIGILTGKYLEEISQLQDTIVELKAEQDRSLGLARHINEINSAVIEENEILKIDIAYVSMLRDRMKNTISWKVTAPFRKFVRFFR